MFWLSWEGPQVGRRESLCKLWVLACRSMPPLYPAALVPWVMFEAAVLVCHVRPEMRRGCRFCSEAAACVQLWKYASRVREDGWNGRLVGCVQAAMVVSSFGCGVVACAQLCDF